MNNPPERSNPGSLFEILSPEEASPFRIICGDGEISSAEIFASSVQLAHALEQRGVARGDRIGVWLPNVPAWFVAVFACWRLGVVVVSLNPRLQAREAGDLIARTGCKALVMSTDARHAFVADVLRSIVEEQRAGVRLLVTCGAVPAQAVLPGVPQLALDECAAQDATPFARAAPDDACLVLATSGTTSAPKLVLHSQERILRHITDVSRSLDLAAANSRALLALPLCGAFGLTVAMTTLRGQRPLVLMENFVADATAALLQKHRVTHMLGTDDMLDKILAVCENPRPFPHLRMYGHANFNPGLVDFPARAEALGVRLRGAYGMSEMLATFAAQPLDSPLARRALGGGMPVCPAARVRIRDLESGTLLGPQEVGEIEVLSPNVLVEYLGDTAATAAAFTADGYLKTGDLGYLHPEGGFVYLARAKDVLRVGGYLVNPVEIEEVILRDATVAACQVVELPRPEGTRPVAFVVMHAKAACDEPALINRCREYLAIYKVPIRIFEIPAIPTTEGPNGAKVRKSALRELALEMVAKQPSA